MPNKTEIHEVFKLFKLRKNGTLGPLFINKKQVIPLNEWMEAEAHPTKGYAFRPGWHCCIAPEAPHLFKKERRVWARCLAQDTTMYQRPWNQGGAWVLAQKLKVVEILSGKQFYPEFWAN